MDTDDSEPILVSKPQIARRYGVSIRTIQQWMEKDIIPFLKIGYMVRFDVRNCDAAIQKYAIKRRRSLKENPD